MKFELTILLGAALLFTALGDVEAGKGGQKPNPKAAQKKPAPAFQPGQPVPGYRLFAIEGFKVYVSEDVFKADISGYRRPPLQVLGLGLKHIKEVVPPASLGVLQRIHLWIEWDRAEVQKSAGGGLVKKTGFYTPALPKPRPGVIYTTADPRKPRSLTVCSLKDLTQDYQAADRVRFGLVLHELCHGYHDLQLGFDNGDVKAAYAQAMERKLYAEVTAGDGTTTRMPYCTANAREFFAELSLAYLDRLHYFPWDRKKLQEHDPVTFNLMAKVWRR